MKILLMTDMEGCAGILNHDDWVLPAGHFYEKGVRLLTGEINAAVGGFFDAGADEVVVVDGHGCGGIDPETLDTRCRLFRGATDPVWPWLLDSSFDGMGFVGQHAKAGTPFSHITHTGWFNYRDLSINGISIGEYGQLALCAMELGVPVILACGEQALVEEAEALNPGVFTVAGKRGLRPDGLDHLDTDAYRCAKLSAIHDSPSVVRQRIRRAAVAAVRCLRDNPSAFQAPNLTPPYTRVSQVRRFGDQPAGTATDQHPSSVIALFNQAQPPIVPDPV